MPLSTNFDSLRRRPPEAALTRNDGLAWTADGYAPPSRTGSRMHVQVARPRQTTRTIAGFGNARLPVRRSVPGLRRRQRHELRRRPAGSRRARAATRTSTSIEPAALPGRPRAMNVTVMPRGRRRRCRRARSRARRCSFVTPASRSACRSLVERPRRPAARSRRADGDDDDARKRRAAADADRPQRARPARR